MTLWTLTWLCLLSNRNARLFGLKHITISLLCNLWRLNGLHNQAYAPKVIWIRMQVLTSWVRFYGPDKSCSNSFFVFVYIICFSVKLEMVWLHSRRTHWNFGRSFSCILLFSIYSLLRCLWNCPGLSGQLNVSFRKAVSFMWTESKSYLSSNKQVFYIHAGQAGVPVSTSALITTKALHYEKERKMWSSFGTENWILFSIRMLLLELFKLIRAVYFLLDRFVWQGLWIVF